MTQSLHESFVREEHSQLPSERKFGYTMAAVFLLFAIISLFYAGHITSKNICLTAIAITFASLALFAPARLQAPNKWWMKLGLLLHRITNPIIMMLLYIITIIPIGLALKLLGKDPLRRTWDKKASSYWIPREPGPKPETMPYQF